MQGDMNVYLRAFYRCQSLTWRQAACFCSYGSHAGNFAVREAFVSQLRVVGNKRGQSFNFGYQVTTKTNPELEEESKGKRVVLRLLYLVF
ncbi:unnamed protein product [Musa banksii]